MDQNLVQSKQRGPLGKDIWQILKRLARGENIGIDLSTDMGPRFFNKTEGREKGGNRYISFSSHYAPRPASPPPPCTIPGARAASTPHFASPIPRCVAFLGYCQRGQLGETTVLAPPHSILWCEIYSNCRAAAQGEARQGHRRTRPQRRHALLRGERPCARLGIDHIVGRPSTPGPPGKRCRLVWPIFYPFSFSSRCLKVQESVPSSSRDERKISPSVLYFPSDNGCDRLRYPPKHPTDVCFGTFWAVSQPIAPRHRVGGACSKPFVYMCSR